MSAAERLLSHIQKPSFATAANVRFPPEVSIGANGPEPPFNKGFSAAAQLTLSRHSLSAIFHRQVVYP
ncbi:hypothetical protein [Falsihalocynthiibacter arcticus]|uniref:hypothetical protein n=1 Tax=Falsihalocynthiibacter arcticus TaxID=1579316 RepID=UPI0012E95EC1|nr:hypothetical protein [Falsihalocynthiibacter arcticus]